MKTLLLCSIAFLFSSQNSFAVESLTDQISNVESRINRKIELYKSEQAFYVRYCSNADKDIAEAKGSRDLLAKTTGPMIVSPLVAFGGIAALLGMGAVEGIPVVAFGAALGYGSVKGGQYLVYRDKKYVVVEAKDVPQTDPTITFNHLLESAPQVSRGLMNQRAEFETKARDFIEKRLSRGVGNFMGIQSVRREEASKALYCYLADWNKAVIKEFKEKLGELSNLKASISAKPSAPQRTNGQGAEDDSQPE